MELSKQELVDILTIGGDFVFLSSHDGDRLGTWVLTGKESFFQYHFIGNPTLPASILLESMLQTGVVSLFVNHMVLTDEKVIVFSSKLRIYKAAEMMLSLSLNVTEMIIRRKIAYLNVTAHQDDQLIAHASFKYKVNQ